MKLITGGVLIRVGGGGGQIFFQKKLSGVGGGGGYSGAKSNCSNFTLKQCGRNYSYQHRQRN